jgi:hypothetical protein
MGRRTTCAKKGNRVHEACMKMVPAPTMVMEGDVSGRSRLQVFQTMKTLHGGSVDGLVGQLRITQYARSYQPLEILMFSKYNTSDGIIVQSEPKSLY